ncbi:hypothetical protein [Haladaptatus caseinilyticus]|uniref:hypothetical protein n=1 Tax=Haladaptatus caseinilyticus TaxID=2993314 RepID=UPI00224AE0D0|nr:hypothetical protein [Haladaptatus caseinilyticus]
MCPELSSYHIQRLQSDEVEQVQSRLQDVGMMWEDIVNADISPDRSELLTILD